jgi:hypothetical protein
MSLRPMPTRSKIMPMPYSTSDCLAQFRALVLADETLQDNLRAPDSTEQFIALCLQTARDCGLQLGADDLRQAMQRIPADGLLNGGEWRGTALPPHGWLPSDTSWQRGQLLVQWSYFGNQRLREPFFHGDVQRIRFKPFNRLSTT